MMYKNGRTRIEIEHISLCIRRYQTIVALKRSAGMLDQLLNYAKSANPERDIPSSVRLVHDRHTLTVFDLYPKGQLLIHTRA